MQIDFMQALDKGFTVVFGLCVLFYFPKLIKVWTGFNLSIQENTAATRHVGEMVRDSAAHSKTLLEELKDLKYRLEKHDENAHDVKGTQAEIMKVLEEIKKEIASR